MGSFPWRPAWQPRQRREGWVKAQNSRCRRCHTHRQVLLISFPHLLAPNSPLPWPLGSADVPPHTPRWLSLLPHLCSCLRTLHVLCALSRTVSHILPLPPLNNQVLLKCPLLTGPWPHQASSQCVCMDTSPWHFRPHSFHPCHD